jgi:predicted permease
MNSEMMFKVMLAIGQTFVFFAVGAAAVKCKYLDSRDVSRVGNFAMDFIFPCCCFVSVFNGMQDADPMAVWLPPVLGFSIMAFNGIIGLGLQYGLKNRSESRMKAFRQMAAINNYLFLPLIIVESLYGSSGSACLMLFSVGSAVGFWSVGIWVMSKFGFNKETFKNLISSNLVAVLLAVLLVCCKVPVPEEVLRIANGIGVIGTPLMLVLTGASLTLSGAALFREGRDAAWGVLCRLIIIPALTVAALKMIPMPPMVFNVALIIALMPTSCASVIIVGKYGGDVDYSGQQLLLSTFISPVTITGFLYLSTLF